MFRTTLFLALNFVQEIAGKEKVWRSRIEEMEKNQKVGELHMEKDAEKVSQKMEEMKQKYMQELEIARYIYVVRIISMLIYSNTSHKHKCTIPS